MFKLTIILLLVLIVGDRNRSLAGISKSVSQSEDLQARCNGYCFSSMRSMMDFIVANQDQWNTCKAIIANDTRADQNQVKAQLSGLQETVTGMQNQQQILSKDFEDRLGRLDSQLAAINEILTNHTSLQPKAVTTEKIPPPKFELIGSRYFYIEQNIKLNWFAAANQCREMGGHLATFKDKDEMLLMQPKMSSSIWLGINCLSKRYDHVSSASGKPASYFNWGLSEPLINNDTQRCVKLDETLEMWYYDCASSCKFICQADDSY
ncbi:accessory gland protein Acp29AB-like [Drosophila subpulchrella]|uniref:accessory gland protein Acp29AB-like n=1 Tax=Drosophila subpulchrella TaxID=1486046 RepID=UPI0018A164EF|nr:accessory gland protein Acp29AB-like [Drosophila subpulchrella]